MLTIEKLKHFGCNTDEGLMRCMNNEAFYFRMIGILKDSPDFDNLYKTIDAKDYKAAFVCAHTLKGVVGNLSITPLFRPIQEITEYLRNNTEMDYSVLINEIRVYKAVLDKLIEE